MTDNAQTTTADIVSLERFRAKKARAPGPEPVIAWWKCRVGVCMVRCGVTQTAIDVLKMFNDELKRRRERPIEQDDVMVCDDHKDRLVKARW